MSLRRPDDTGECRGVDIRSESMLVRRGLDSVVYRPKLRVFFCDRLVPSLVKQSVEYDKTHRTCGQSLVLRRWLENLGTAPVNDKTLKSVES